MKQLKKFIGVYILALCATNAALGAMYGSYDATCTKDTDITIKIFGAGITDYGRSKEFSKIYTTKLDLNTGTWNLDDAFRTNYLDTELTGAKTGTYTLTDGSVISNGLELRGIIFYSAGAIDENEPYAADFIDANLNYISTKTSCGLSGFYNGFEEGEKKKLAEAFSIEKSKLKNKSQTISTEILNLLVGTFNIKQINLIAVYAANCVKTPKNATCKLTIGNSGSAMYTNSCSGGCDMSENSFGIDATFCVDSNAIAPKSVKAPMSDSVSK